MFLLFLGVNDKIVNFATTSLIEDKSTDDQSRATVTTIDGTELEFEDADADAVLARAELLMEVTDKFLMQLQGVSNN